VSGGQPTLCFGAPLQRELWDDAGIEVGRDVTGACKLSSCGILGDRDSNGARRQQVEFGEAR
jgi:hypothetical protein